MARWLVLVVLACGCRQIWGLGGTPELAIDAATADVPADTAIDGPPCFGSFGDAPYCFDTAPAGAFMVVTATNLNTQNSTDCSPLFQNECVVAAALVEIDAPVAVIGTRPLVLISTSILYLSTNGGLDAASHRGSNAGAASNPSSCDIGNNPNNAGGGQGGSFGGAGGDGGKSESGGGGSAGPTIVPLALQGGCDGQDGGAGGGANGNGGGVIYVIAVGQIEIEGSIDASGSAGGGGTGNVRGGGGGGSGGMIVLEAPLINVQAQGVVFANGGGGGGGASASGNGANGNDPTDVTSALGGVGGTLSGQGGNGSGIAMPNGQAGFEAPGAGGGGGGGGGAGVIKTIGGTITNMLAVSPAPS